MTDPAAQDPLDEVEQHRMTLGEHLEELRSRLVRSCIVIAVCFAACWGFRKQLDDFVQRPYDSARTKLNAELLVLAESEIEEDEAAWKGTASSNATSPASTGMPLTTCTPCTTCTPSAL